MPPGPPEGAARVPPSPEEPAEREKLAFAFQNTFKMPLQNGRNGSIFVQLK